MKRQFPPPQLADLDGRSAGAFLALAREINRGPITLFLGSGVSASAGLPIWTELLTRICAVFFEHWQRERPRKAKGLSPPRELSVAFWEQFFWSDETVRLAEEFAKGDPLLVAQQIKNCIRDIDWRYLLNKTLYSGESGTIRSGTMEALARLCAARGAVAAVVNFNYDSLFEDYLGELQVEHSVVWSSDSHARPGSLPVVHPHGYLRLGGGPVTQLVLGEDDYFQHSRTPYAWPDVILIGYLSQSTCVFVGSSMTDPNVRRFLRLGRPVSSHRHFAFLPRSIDEVERDAMFRSLFDRDLEILGVRPIRFPLRTRENGVYSRIRELLDLLVTFNVDSEAIWRLVDSGPAT